MPVKPPSRSKNIFSSSEESLLPLLFLILAALGLGCGVGSLLLCEGFLLLWSSGAFGLRWLQLLGSAVPARKCGTWAQLLHVMWNLPWPGIQPASPALVGRLPTTGPPGKSSCPFGSVPTFPTFPGRNHCFDFSITIDYFCLFWASYN